MDENSLRETEERERDHVGTYIRRLWKEVEERQALRPSEKSSVAADNGEPSQSKESNDETTYTSPLAIIPYPTVTNGALPSNYSSQPASSPSAAASHGPIPWSDPARNIATSYTAARRRAVSSSYPSALPPNPFAVTSHETIPSGHSAPSPADPYAEPDGAIASSNYHLPYSADPFARSNDERTQSSYHSPYAANPFARSNDEGGPSSYQSPYSANPFARSNEERTQSSYHSPYAAHPFAMSNDEREPSSCHLPYEANPFARPNDERLPSSYQPPYEANPFARSNDEKVPSSYQSPYSANPYARSLDERIQSSYHVPPRVANASPASNHERVPSSPHSSSRLAKAYPPSIHDFRPSSYSPSYAANYYAKLRDGDGLYAASTQRADAFALADQAAVPSNDSSPYVPKVYADLSFERTIIIAPSHQSKSYPNLGSSVPHQTFLDLDSIGGASSSNQQEQGDLQWESNSLAANLQYGSDTIARQRHLLERMDQSIRHVFDYWSIIPTIAIDVSKMIGQPNETKSLLAKFFEVTKRRGHLRPRSYTHDMDRIRKSRTARDVCAIVVNMNIGFGTVALYAAPNKCVERFVYTTPESGVEYKMFIIEPFWECWQLGETEVINIWPVLGSVNRDEDVDPGDQTMEYDWESFESDRAYIFEKMTFLALTWISPSYDFPQDQQDLASAGEGQYLMAYHSLKSLELIREEVFSVYRNNMKENR